MTKPPRPGYWLANDGKWYPPEFHPDRVRAVLDAERLAAEEPVHGEPVDVDSIDIEPVVVEPADDSAADIEPPMVESSTDPAHDESEPEVVETTIDEAEDTTDSSDEVEATTGPPDESAAGAEHPEASRWERNRVAPAETPVESQPDADQAAPTPSKPEPQTTPVESELVEPVSEPVAPADPTSLSDTTTAEVAESSDRAPLFTPPVADSPPVASSIVVPPKPEAKSTPVIPPPAIKIPPDVPGLENQRKAAAEPVAKTAIPDPFPEPDQESLVAPEDGPSFLQRWWKAIATMLVIIVAVNLLVWWVQRDDSSEAANELDVFELAEGTCIDEPTLAEETEVQGSVNRVSCLDSHTHEVFHTVQHPAGDFDLVLIQRFAETECVSKFETYTGTLYDRSVLNFVLLLPNEKAWDDEDRSTICALYDDSGPTTGSAKLVP